MRKMCAEVNCIAVGSEKGRCAKHQLARKPKPKGMNDAFYSSKAWRDLRIEVLRESPICCTCLSFGQITPACHVDHIIPIGDGGETLDCLNLQALCQSCHQRKTNKENATRRKAALFAADRAAGIKSKSVIQ